MGKKKKKKTKKAKPPKEVDVLHYDSTKEYTIVQIHTMLEQIEHLTQALDADLKAMHAEASFCETTEDHLKLAKREIETWRAKSDLMSTFAHLALDVGKKERQEDGERFKKRVKAMEDKLRKELEERFKLLNQKITKH